MKPDISVIVPVYNVELYLPRCLDSLCAQDFQNVEFLLVDDGSSDNCGTICERYAQMDSRIQVFHKKNGGLSSARNYALDRATGRYVMFVDSDDWVTPDFCSTALKVAEQKKADVVMFAFQEINEKQNILKKRPFPNEGYKNQEEAVDLILGHVGDMVWNKFYKKELFQNIRFPEGRLFEDIAVTYQLIYKADVIYCLDHILYYYLIRNSSISHDRNVSSTRDYFDMRKLQFEDLKRYGFPETKRKFYLQDMAMHHAITMNSDPYDKMSVWAHQVLQSMNKAPAGFSWKRKIMFRVYKFSPRLFDLCCVIWRKRVS